MLNYKVPKTVHISGVLFGAALAEFPPTTIPLPVAATSPTLLLSVLIELTVAYATAFALASVVWYGVTCTDTMELNSAAPVKVPSAVGYAVAAPAPPVTSTVPNQVPTTAEESGAPAAAEENGIDPL